MKFNTYAMLCLMGTAGAQQLQGQGQSVVLPSSMMASGSQQGTGTGRSAAQGTAQSGSTTATTHSSTNPTPTAAAPANNEGAATNAAHARNFEEEHKLVQSSWNKRTEQMAELNKKLEAIKKRLHELEEALKKSNEERKVALEKESEEQKNLEKDSKETSEAMDKRLAELEKQVNELDKKLENEKKLHDKLPANATAHDAAANKAAPHASGAVYTGIMASPAQRPVAVSALRRRLQDANVAEQQRLQAEKELKEKEKEKQAKEKEAKEKEMQVKEKEKEVKEKEQKEKEEKEKEKKEKEEEEKRRERVAEAEGAAADKSASDRKDTFKLLTAALRDEEMLEGRIARLHGYMARLRRRVSRMDVDEHAKVLERVKKIEEIMKEFRTNGVETVEKLEKEIESIDEVVKKGVRIRSRFDIFHRSTQATEATAPSSVVVSTRAVSIPAAHGEASTESSLSDTEKEEENSANETEEEKKEREKIKQLIKDHPEDEKVLGARVALVEHRLIKINKTLEELPKPEADKLKEKGVEKLIVKIDKKVKSIIEKVDELSKKISEKLTKIEKEYSLSELPVTTKDEVQPVRPTAEKTKSLSVLQDTLQKYKTKVNDIDHLRARMMRVDIVSKKVSQDLRASTEPTAKEIVQLSKEMNEVVAKKIKGVEKNLKKVEKKLKLPTPQLVNFMLAKQKEEAKLDATRFPPNPSAQVYHVPITDVLSRAVRRLSAILIA